MISALKKLFGRTYQPLNKIEINALFLHHNYSLLSAVNPSIRIAPVLKSNAYGHGIVQVAKILDTLNAPFFCVDSIYEGYELLKAGIRTKILIMGYIDPENLKVKKLPFSYAVYNKEQLKVIQKHQQGAGIHIKFDSGMHRLGVTVEELPGFLETLKLCNFVTIEGFMSHFSESEHPNSDLSKLQLENFTKGLELVKQSFNPPFIHFANSAGLLNHDKLNLGSLTNMARVGLALYGVDPRNTKANTYLKPALRFSTKIVQIKKLKKGDRVGYNGTLSAKKDMTIASLPLGYYDAVDRRLSNKGIMLVNGQDCPIVGRVSMNITSIDISLVPNPFIGQEVLVYSNLPDDPNSIQKSAELCETIPYDILVHLAASTRREIV